MLIATEYFTKWIEAMSLTNIIGKHIVTFILNYIIFHYGIPMTIITNNGRPFKNQDVRELYENFQIQLRFSTL